LTAERGESRAEKQRRNRGIKQTHRGERKKERKRERRGDHVEQENKMS